MTLEDRLTNWTGPSSDTEQDKQERTERMIREALQEHAPLANCARRVFAKGSYANNTNVRADSDVDIAVLCTEAEYWGEYTPGCRTSPGSPYKGSWTPERFRAEIVAALQRKFPGQVDTSGPVALTIRSSTARVDADVVPCFGYRFYLPGGSSREGTKIFKASGGSLINYPDQQLSNGRAKNKRTNGYYKSAVRILKRVENALATTGKYKDLPSYFMECLAYNCPDELFEGATWTETIRDLLVHMWNDLDGSEPQEEDERWLEVNECVFLFHDKQKWTRDDGKGFARAAWNFLGYN